jgi:hypothetical protein
MLLKPYLGSLLLLALSPLWFADAHSAVRVLGHYSVRGRIESQSESCRWSLPAQQFLKLSDSGKTELLNGCDVIVLIEGMITGDDGSDFVKLRSWSDGYYKRSKLGYLWQLRLNSAGGSVVASIMMAKAIRASALMHDRGMGWIGPGDKCYSACVIVLAASYRRSVAGRVGIHRPYFVGDEYTQMGYKDLKQAYDGLYEELSALFKQWNLSRPLVDDMFAVPSTGVRILTDEELSAYGLNKDDWVLTEEFNADTRAACGEEAAVKGSVEDAVAASAWWASPKGQECQRKLNALAKARSVARIKRLCGEASANAYERGQRVSQECVDRIKAAE